MDRTKIRPLGDRLLVEFPRGMTTRGGIHLHDNAKEPKLQTGLILAVGERTAEELNEDVRPGDSVVAVRNAGVPLNEPGSETDLRMLRADDVRALRVTRKGKTSRT